MLFWILDADVLLRDFQIFVKPNFFSVFHPIPETGEDGKEDEKADAKNDNNNNAETNNNNNNTKSTTQSRFHFENLLFVLIFF